MRQIGFVPSADFNPRFHEGSDGADLVCDIGCILISIHAPARGATHHRYKHYPYWHISIHAPARGATIIVGVTSMRPVFQSTLPRGERPLPIVVVLHVSYISIHAPARGATLFAVMLMQNIVIFQSTLPRGERHINVFSTNHITNFNPRSREGSDKDHICKRYRVTISIHAPARGATDS